MAGKNESVGANGANGANGASASADASAPAVFRQWPAAAGAEALAPLAHVGLEALAGRATGDGGVRFRERPVTGCSRDRTAPSPVARPASAASPTCASGVSASTPSAAGQDRKSVV